MRVELSELRTLYAQVIKENDEERVSRILLPMVNLMHLENLVFPIMLLKDALSDVPKP